MSAPVLIDVHVNVLRQMGYNTIHEWLQHPDHVYIGRSMLVSGTRIPGSIWANPFKGDDRQAVVQQYYQYVCQNWHYYGPLISTLRGKVLGCWCVGSSTQPTGAQCHGHVLQYLYNTMYPQTPPQ